MEELLGNSNFVIGIVLCCGFIVVLINVGFVELTNFPQVVIFL